MGQPQRNEGLLLNYTASGAIEPKRLVKFGAGDRIVVQASAATDGVIGVNDLVAADGQRTDVCLSGIFPVTYGGAVTRGDALTSDASGRAIKATVAGSKIIGYAMASGVLGQVGSVLFDRSTLSA